MQNQLSRGVNRSSRIMRRPAWLLGVAALAMVLSACGGASAPTEAPTAAPPAEVPTQAPPVVVPTAAPPEALEAQPVMPTAVAGGPTAVANVNTWVYSGPGANYVVYAALVGGRSAQVTGTSQDGLWWAISVPVAPDGNGWVQGSAVTVSGVANVPVLAAPPVPPTTAITPPGPSDPQATALVNTFVRSGPDETWPAFGVAPAGVSGRVIGRSEDGAWWAVRLDPTVVGTGYGWVLASTVQTVNTQDVPVVAAGTKPVLATPPPPPAGVPAATAVDFINVRTGPGTCHTVLAVAPPGSSGEITGRSQDGEWFQVRVSSQLSDSGLAWVSAGFVTTSNAGGVPVAEGPSCPS
jgi:uncharacterized protein YraI